MSEFNKMVTQHLKDLKDRDLPLIIPGHNFSLAPSYHGGSSGWLLVYCSCGWMGGDAHHSVRYILTESWQKHLLTMIDKAEALINEAFE